MRNRKRAIFLATAVAAIASATGLAVASATAPAPVPLATDLILTDMRAVPLETDPLLAPGERVIVTVRGFAPDTPVKIAPTTLVAVPTVRANVDGTIRIVYQVPRGLPRGEHVFALSGVPPLDHSPRQAIAIQGTSAGDAIEVAVPKIGLVHFNTESS